MLDANFLTNVLEKEKGKVPDEKNLPTEDQFFAKGYKAALQFVLTQIEEQDRPFQDFLTMKGRLGYILRLTSTVDGKPQFKFREEGYTRTITSNSDKIRSKMLAYAEDFEAVQNNTDIITHDHMMLVESPFFLDDELRQRVKKWVEWANKADPSEYDPFETARKGLKEEEKK